MMNATAIEIILKLLILIEYAAKVMGWRWRKGGDVEWRSLDIPIEGTGLVYIAGPTNYISWPDLH